MSKRNLLRLVLALVAVSAIGYAHWRQRAVVAPAPHALAAPIAANARQFALGTLTFKACELPQRHSSATTAAYCAPFSVAENPDAADSRRIDLNLALIKADAEAADTDLVVFLAGGPGQAAIEAWPRVASAFAPLRKHHHIILLDQRGTGGSNAMTCAGAADGPADSEADLDALRRRTRACLEHAQQHADPRFYTTTQAIGDLEALRQALGAPQFDLVGVSYGTRVAQQYAMRHGDGVRSIVLDSVAPNEIVLGQDFAANLETALKAQFELCTRAPDCAAAFPDPHASLLQLRDALRAQPRSFDFRDPVSWAPGHMRLDVYTLAGIVRMFAYSPETAALLPLTIAEGLKGNYAPLAGQAQLLSRDLAELEESGMQLSVLCAEDADQLAPRPEDADTVLNSVLIDVIRAQCAIWPKGTRPDDFHAPLHSAKPILVLEGEFDPVTPPRYGEQVLKNFSNARLLVARGQGHNVIGRGCIPRLVGEFVDKLAPTTLDASCADALGPTRPFTSFSGAAP